MSNQITTLISQASEKLGSDNALAMRLGVPRQMISMWKNGARPCPPEDQARIAAVLGLDPVEALVGAVLERHEGTPKGAALADLFCDWKSRKKKAPDNAGARFGGNGGIRTLDEALHPILP